MRNCYQPNHCAMPYAPPETCGSPMEPECPCYLAIANVPWQYFRNSYEPAKALQIGTVFPELDKPFTGRGVRG